MLLNHGIAKEITSAIRAQAYTHTSSAAVYR
jgi:hypothetical protein